RLRRAVFPQVHISLRMTGSARSLSLLLPESGPRLSEPRRVALARRHTQSYTDHAAFSERIGQYRISRFGLYCSPGYRAGRPWAVRGGPMGGTKLALTHALIRGLPSPEGLNEDTYRDA